MVLDAMVGRMHNAACSECNTGFSKYQNAIMTLMIGAPLVKKGADGEDADTSNRARYHQKMVTMKKRLEDTDLTEGRMTVQAYCIIAHSDRKQSMRPD